MVVDSASTNGQVRIAAYEVNDDFLADSGNVHGSQLVAGPLAGHAQPAGAVLVVLAQPVPGKMHLDAAQFVGPDVLAFRADHHSDLRATGMRFGLTQVRAQRLGRWVGGEVDFHLPLLLAVDMGAAGQFLVVVLYMAVYRWDNPKMPAIKSR